MEVVDLHYNEDEVKVVVEKTEEIIRWWEANPQAIDAIKMHREIDPQQNFAGHLADKAVADFLRVPWVPKIDRFTLPDVGGNVYALYTSAPYLMPIKKYAKDHSFHVMVKPVGELPDYPDARPLTLRVWGYVPTNVARVIGTYKNYGNFANGDNVWITIEQLRPIAELRAFMETVGNRELRQSMLEKMPWLNAQINATQVQQAAKAYKEARKELWKTFKVTR